MSETTTGNKQGCMIIGVIFVVLLVLLGALGLSYLLGAWSDEGTPSARNDAGQGRSTPSPSASPTGAACEDATAAFRTFAGPRPGMSAVLERVTSVCWEPGGELRAEAAYAADINATSAPMASLCRALSEFVTGSGRTWRGFTVYSTSQVTAGKPFLAGPTEGGPCTNPQHRN